VSLTKDKQNREQYINLLRERRPIALLIYAYWCTIMHQGPSRWFTQGWARRAAYASMSNLGADWDAWLEWPRFALEQGPIVFKHPDSIVGEQLSALISSGPEKLRQA
jgi:hypothetical protein